MTETSIYRLFDFQKFARNPRLSAMVADTESRYGTARREITEEDDLTMVNAAAGLPDVDQKARILHKGGEKLQ